MHLILTLFLVVATAGALAQQYSTPSSAPVSPDTAQAPTSEAVSTNTATSVIPADPGLPDAPSRSCSPAPPLTEKTLLTFIRRLEAAADRAETVDVALPTNPARAVGSTLFYQGRRKADITALWVKEASGNVEHMRWVARSPPTDTTMQPPSPTPRNSSLSALPPALRPASTPIRPMRIATTQANVSLLVMRPPWAAIP